MLQSFDLQLITSGEEAKWNQMDFFFLSVLSHHHRFLKKLQITPPFTSSFALC